MYKIKSDEERDIISDWVMKTRRLIRTKYPFAYRSEIHDSCIDLGHAVREYDFATKDNYTTPLKYEIVR